MTRKAVLVVGMALGLLLGLLLHPLLESEPVTAFATAGCVPATSTEPKAISQPRAADSRSASANAPMRKRRIAATRITPAAQVSPQADEPFDALLRRALAALPPVEKIAGDGRISGEVLYDDGTPCAGAVIELVQRNILLCPSDPPPYVPWSGLPRAQPDYAAIATAAITEAREDDSKFFQSVTGSDGRFEMAGFPGGAMPYCLNVRMKDCEVEFADDPDHSPPCNITADGEHIRCVAKRYYPVRVVLERPELVADAGVCLLVAKTGEPGWREDWSPLWGESEATISLLAGTYEFDARIMNAGWDQQAYECSTNLPQLTVGGAVREFTVKLALKPLPGIYGTVARPAGLATGDGAYLVCLPYDGVPRASITGIHDLYCHDRAVKCHYSSPDDDTEHFKFAGLDAGLWSLFLTYQGRVLTNTVVRVSDSPVRADFAGIALSDRG